MLTITEASLSREQEEALYGARKISSVLRFQKERAAEKIFLSRDNPYGANTVLFDLTLRDEAEKTFTLGFAPIALISRRRIALQKKWFDYPAEAINPAGSPLTCKILLYIVPCTKNF